jgi:predicted Zn-dependent protease
MFRRFAWLAVLAGLIGAGVAVSFGSMDDEVDLSAAMELWGDVMRDADALGTHILRTSDAEEMTLGRQLTTGSQSWLNEKPEETAYVRAVAASLATEARRRGISYSVHVVDEPFVNAWAMPGGQIYVTTAMLAFVRSEAELAAVLGHEIAHVDQRHCIDRYEYQIKLRKVGAGGLGEAVDFARQFADAGYSKYQEADADAAGLRFMIDAGYDPSAAVEVMRRFGQQQERPVDSRPRSVLTEAGAITSEALGTYLASHPAPNERVRRLTARIRAERRRIGGKSFYVGAENLKRRIPRNQQRMAGEMKNL